MLVVCIAILGDDGRQMLYTLRRYLNRCRPQISTESPNSYEKTIGALFGDSVDWAPITNHYPQQALESLVLGFVTRVFSFRSLR